MDLANDHQVAALLHWVEQTEGRLTAIECEKLVRERRAANRCEVQSRLELVDLARQRAHEEKVVNAIELTKAKLDSRLRFDE